MPLRCLRRSKQAGVEIKSRIPGLCSASFRSMCTCCDVLGHLANSRERRAMGYPDVLLAMSKLLT